MHWILLLVIIGVTCVLLLAKFWKNIVFQFKFISFLAIGYILVLVMLPTTFRRPGDAQNNVLTSLAIVYCCRWIGVRYELRGQEHLEKEQGAMLAANHQQMIDLMGVMSAIREAGRVTFIMKRGLSLHPGGFASKMFGVVFLDRTGSNRSHEDLNSWAFQAKEEKNKVWIHPEGTRNFEAFKSQCLLPFKKGTFHAAIAAQIPIIPYVLSPYYFIDHDRKYFGKGTVIMEALEPIPTEGMSANDLPRLMDHLRTVMTQKYRQLTDEVLASLPSGHPIFQWINDVE